jgi:tryptophan 7-halogenase
MNVVILGGGSAGWMTALMVKAYYPNETITVVESDDIGILGAGEGTTPQFVFSFLDVVGIPASDLIRECKATIKHGIRFLDWNGKGHSYYHAFASQEELSQFNNFIVTKQIADGLPVHELDFSSKASANGNVAFSFKPNPNTLLENPINSFNNHSSWALHFDARLLAQYFRRTAESRGIKRVEGKVKHFEQDEHGNVTKLNLESGQSVDVDFIFDCSGFARLIIGKLYNTEWISYADHLPMKTAVPFFMDHDNNTRPETDSIAMKYGWIWRIPVDGRYGCGYVFDSDYITPDQALQEAEEYFGRELKSPKTFTFKAGSFKETVVKNCMAVGLAQSFVEPLEATSIWVSVLNLKRFLNEDGLRCNDAHFAKKVNEVFLKRNNEVLEFLYIHYLTKRDDSPFWREFKIKNKMIDSVAETLELLKNNQYMDMSDRMLFTTKSWIMVAADLGLLDKDKCKNIISKYNVDQIETHKLSLMKNHQNVIRTCLSHKEFLEYMK